MKLILFVLLFLVCWAIVKVGDTDPDWYDDEQ